MGDYDVLLLDFGGVCLVNPVELHEALEASLGLERGTIDWLGPLDPSTDDLWQALLDGAVSERDYWAQRAAEVGRLAGQDYDVKGYFRHIYEPAGDHLIRPACIDVVGRARAAGLGVSVLTNDLQAFHGPTWTSGFEFLDMIDHLVDCSTTGVLKPDPRAFDHAATIVGCPLDRMLFVDDQPGNVAGARQVGLETVEFDIANADESWKRVAAQLGLG